MTQSRGTRAVAVASIGAVVMGASIGCSTTVGGAATDNGLWNSCNISDSTLREAGLDPATKSEGIVGVAFDNFWQCRWKNAKFEVVVISTDYSFEEVKTNESRVNVQPVEIPGRPGAVTYVVTGYPGPVCDVAFPGFGGTIMVRASSRTLGSRQGNAEECEFALQTERILDKELPR